MRIWSAMDMEMLSVRWDSSRCVKERVRQSAKEPKIRNETYLPKIGKETYLLVMVDRPILGCLRRLKQLNLWQVGLRTSAEIYIICLKYKARAKIQPELLDIKHLFSVVPENSKVQ
ncbi:unnamed protein product [Urochloa humidicola]